MTLNARRYYIGALVFAFVFAVPSGTEAGSPLCGYNPDLRFNANREPITRISVRVRQIVNPADGRDTSTIAVGSKVTLDATPKDSSNTPTNGKGEPSWKFTGPAVSIRDTCYLPQVSVTGTGPITATITQDGVSAKISFGVGGTVDGGGGGTGGGTGGGITAEDDTYCAYKDPKGAYTCIMSSRGTAKCADIPDCKGKTCEKVGLEKCPAGGGAFSKSPPTPERPAEDLGALITDVFDWSLGILGIAVFVMMLYGGFTMLLSAGSPGIYARGKEMMTNAVLGALLLLASYLILNTINPDFVKQQGGLPAIPPATKSSSGNQPPPAPVPAPAPAP